MTTTACGPCAGTGQAPSDLRDLESPEWANSTADAQPLPEELLELTPRGATRSPAAQARLEKRYAKSLELFARAERDLARAANRWDNLRRMRNRLERELDRTATHAGD